MQSTFILSGSVRKCRVKWKCLVRLLFHLVSVYYYITIGDRISHQLDLAYLLLMIRYSGMV